MRRAAPTRWIPTRDREVTVRLARDDVPVAGRLVDLEGRPVAGATVRVVSIDGPPGGDLTPWLAAMAARGRTRVTSHNRHLRRLRITAYDGLPEIPAATTGPDGRFTIRGIGRERVAVLKVEGPTIRTMEASVMTRAGEPVRAGIFGRRKNDWVRVYHAARFELTAPPSRPIEGFVRDRDTGAPIAGAAIRSYRLADQDLGNYQIVGDPDRRGGPVPPDRHAAGQGERGLHLPARRPAVPAVAAEARELTADGPLRVEFVLKRGVWVEGKVTDKVTGKPAWARIRYAAAKDNPHLAEAPGFGEVWENGEYTERRRDRRRRGPTGSPSCRGGASSWPRATARSTPVSISRRAGCRDSTIISPHFMEAMPSRRSTSSRTGRPRAATSRWTRAGRSRRSSSIPRGSRWPGRWSTAGGRSRAGTGRRRPSGSPSTG